MFLLSILTVVLTAGLHAGPARRRALLIGINDYSASGVVQQRAGMPNREWSNLDGTLNDVEMMRDLLVALHGFNPSDIVMLTDQQATRDAILHAIEQHLIAKSRKDDIALFYFSGHGSQVRNSLSSEPDRLDESLVPADSRRGALDIRDKELLPLFNRLLDRGAHLTIVLDSCHSGSGARGLPGGLHYRAVSPDLRDVADASAAPRPEHRGALILSATQDFDLAFETLDDRGRIRGAFTWALARAIRDADRNESASDTFLRACARLRAERPSQDPVLAGDADARARPFLGTRGERRTRAAKVAVEKAVGDQTYLLQGGWANGLTVGSELRLVGCDDVRLEVTSLDGITHAKARVSRGSVRVEAGALLEIVTWAAPPAAPLRVWIPRAQSDIPAAARALRHEAAQRNLRWINDPTETTPTHLLRWRETGWELLAKSERIRAGGGVPASIPPKATLFVQLPASSQIVDAIGSVDGVDLTSGPETADYVLVGRLTEVRIEYAWIHPLVTAADSTRCVLPLRSAWVPPTDAPALRTALLALRRVQAWNNLPSPPGASAHYRLGIRRDGDGSLVDDGRLLGKHRYRLVLHAREASAVEPLYARYVYAFVIDSHGNSILLFPSAETGSVENLLPITPTPAQPIRRPPEEIALGADPFEVIEPYGVDTYFLLTTEEPIPSFASLEWRGVRTARITPESPLEKLLDRTLTGTRGPAAPIRTPLTWSIEKVTFESVPPRRAAR